LRSRSNRVPKTEVISVLIILGLNITGVW
jgi:hypothetical protein